MRSTEVVEQEIKNDTKTEKEENLKKIYSDPILFEYNFKLNEELNYKVQTKVVKIIIQNGEEKEDILSSSGILSYKGLLKDKDNDGTIVELTSKIFNEEIGDYEVVNISQIIVKKNGECSSGGFTKFSDKPIKINDNWTYKIESAIKKITFLDIIKYKNIDVGKFKIETLEEEGKNMNENEQFRINDNGTYYFDFKNGKFVKLDLIVEVIYENIRDDIKKINKTFISTEII